MSEQGNSGLQKRRVLAQARLDADRDGLQHESVVAGPVLEEPRKKRVLRAESRPQETGTSAVVTSVCEDEHQKPFRVAHLTAAEAGRSMLEWMFTLTKRNMFDLYDLGCGWFVSL